MFCAVSKVCLCTGFVHFQTSVYVCTCMFRCVECLCMYVYV